MRYKSSKKDADGKKVVTHFECSYCEQSVHYAKYADHIAKYHRWDTPNFRVMNPTPCPKRPPIIVFAECFQQEAGLEDYGSIAEWKRLTGQK